MRTRAIATVPAAVVLALVAGCSGSTSRSGSASDSPTAGSSASGSSSPAPSDGSSTPSGSPRASGPTSPSGPTQPTLRDRLLGAGELPTFNPQTRWRTGSTVSTEAPTSFGTCQRFDVTSIGAERVVIRRYLPSGDDMSDLAARAGELVARFPDEPTARRAFSVLEAWRARCGDRLKRFRTSRVGAAETVPVGGGTATWYLLTYGPPPKDQQARFFDAQGAVRVGARIAMVSMLTVGRAYHYEPGHEPMVAALQRAAHRLS